MKSVFKLTNIRGALVTMPHKVSTVALLELGRAGKAYVKISGFSKLSCQSFPHEDAWPYVRALVDAFTLDACVWGTDWPFLRAPERMDYGTLLKLIERLFPNADDRRKLLWDTPRALFGF